MASCSAPTVPGVEMGRSEVNRTRIMSRESRREAVGECLRLHLRDPASGRGEVGPDDRILGPVSDLLTSEAPTCPEPGDA